MTKSASATGSANPARCRSPPRSRTSAKGATRRRGTTQNLVLSQEPALPQLVERGASEQSAARNRPSGFSARRICTEGARKIVDELQRKPRHDEIERPIRERQEFRRSLDAGSRGLLSRRCESSMEMTRPTFGSSGDAPPDDAMMAAEIERERKLPLHDPEPLGEVVGIRAAARNHGRPPHRQRGRAAAEAGRIEYLGC